MDLLAAATNVLLDAGEPLHYRELTRRMLERGLWSTKGRTPDATVNARISVEIKQLGERSRFRRVAIGIYGLSGTPSDTQKGEPIAGKFTRRTDGA